MDITEVDLAEIMKRLGDELAFKVVEDVAKLEKEGRIVSKMHIGQPNFDTPDHIKQAAADAIWRGETCYTPSQGLYECREAVAEYVPKARVIHDNITAENVVITPGGKPVIFFGIISTVNPGDEVIYPNPGYPIYESALNCVGAITIPIDNIDELKERMSKSTKMVIINSPQNPKGEVLSRGDLKDIAELAKKYDSLVMSDEVYSKIFYGDSFESILQFPEMLERTLMIDCHSKTHAMTGWRFGYGVMIPKYAKAIARWTTNTSACVPGFTQYAAIAAMEGPHAHVDKMVQEFKERRDILVKGLNEIDGIECPLPEGAFYVFPEVTKLCERCGFDDADQLQQYLLHELDIATLPRIYFGSNLNGKDGEYLRFSYATSRDDIEGALERMRNAL